MFCPSTPLDRGHNIIWGLIQDPPVSFYDPEHDNQLARSLVQDPLLGQAGRSALAAGGRSGAQPHKMGVCLRGILEARGLPIGPARPRPQQLCSSGGGRPNGVEDSHKYIKKMFKMC